jgi:hypothetical protein
MNEETLIQLDSCQAGESASDGSGDAAGTNGFSTAAVTASGAALALEACSSGGTSGSPGATTGVSNSGGASQSNWVSTTDAPYARFLQ